MPLYSFSWILVGCKLMSPLAKMSVSMFFNFSFIRQFKFDIFTFIVANSALYSLIFATLLHDFTFFLALLNDFMNIFSQNNLINLTDDFEYSTCLLLSQHLFTVIKWQVLNECKNSSIFSFLVKGVDFTWKGFLVFGVSGWTAYWVLPFSHKKFNTLSWFSPPFPFISKIIHLVFKETLVLAPVLFNQIKTYYCIFELLLNWVVHVI